MESLHLQSHAEHHHHHHHQQHSSIDSDMSGVTGTEKKGPWSADEDERLKLAIGPAEQPRPKWAEIALKVEGRSAKQCRERWEQNLNPKLDKSPITIDEQLNICHWIDANGKKWAEIARYLTTRSDNTIKNWYNGMIQKGKSGRIQGDEKVRAHFTPDHQNWLSQRAKAPHSQSSHHSPLVASLDPRSSTHRFHPYPLPNRVSAWANDLLRYQGSMGSCSHYTQEQVRASHYPAAAPTSHTGHRLEAPMPSLYPQHDVRPLRAPSPPIQLAPLNPRVLPPINTNTATYPDYRSESSLRPENGYFTHSDVHAPARAASRAQYEAASPASNHSQISQEAPTLRNSPGATPTEGSPRTPALKHDTDTLRRRTSSTDWSNSLEMEHTNEKSAPSGKRKLAVWELCN